MFRNGRHFPLGVSIPLELISSGDMPWDWPHDEQDKQLRLAKPLHRQQQRIVGTGSPGSLVLSERPVDA